MDNDQGPYAKRRKIESYSPSTVQKLPAETRNLFYKLAALPDGVDPESRTFTHGAIAPSDTVQPFFIDAVSEDGKSALFAKDIIQVAELAEEVLTLIIPHILFTFNTPHALEVFAETFGAHTSICNVVPELHIELDFTKDMSKEDLTKLGSWVICDLQHGRDVEMHDHVKKWMSAIELLPKITTIHLILSHIWRDFRELRGLSNIFELSKRPVTFQFPTSSIQLPDYSFYMAQTMAAVEDIEVSEQVGISDTKRTELVEHGCRGFNCNRQRPNV